MLAIFMQTQDLAELRLPVSSAAMPFMISQKQGLVVTLSCARLVLLRVRGSLAALLVILI